MSTGVDFTGLSDPDKEALIARASRLAESEAGLPRDGSFLVTEYVNEQHDWRRATRRAYLYNRPIISLDEVRLRVGAETTAVIPAEQVYVNNTGGYIEASSLALAFGIAPEIITLGLSEPQLEVDYTAGYETIPADIKEAVAMIASVLYLSKKLFEEGTAGAVSFTIGSYMVSFANNKVGGLAGLSNLVPEAAKLILRGYKSAPYVR